MKKMKFFAMVLCITTFGMITTSCSKDDKDLIVGEWKLTYLTSTSVEIDDNGRIYRLTGTSDEYPDDFEEKMKFTKDGIVYTWAYVNGEVNENQDRYVVRDGYLVLEGGIGGVKKFQIEKLVKKELILSYNYDGEIPDHDANYLERLWMEFKKI